MSPNRAVIIEGGVRLNYFIAIIVGDYPHLTPLGSIGALYKKRTRSDDLQKVSAAAAKRASAV